MAGQTNRLTGRKEIVVGQLTDHTVLPNRLMTDYDRSRIAGHSVVAAEEATNQNFRPESLHLSQRII